MGVNRSRYGRACWAWVAVCGWAAVAMAADDGDAPPYRRPPPAALRLPSTPGDHKLTFSTVIGGRPVTLPYLLHLPPAAAEPGRRVPLLVFLHGMGECGTDLSGVYTLGPMTLFPRTGDGVNPALAASWPFAVLCPQCPPRGQVWSDDFMYRSAVELVAAVVHSSDRVDPDRVYATGLSMGGLGTWCVAQEAPDLFAAVAPLSAMQWHPAEAADRLRFVAVWAVTGLDDESRFVESGQAMAAALAGCPVPDRFTFVAHQGHDAYTPMYENPQLYEWLLAHRRPDAAARQRLAARPPATRPSATRPSATRPSATRPSATRPDIPTAAGHYLLTYDTVIDDQPVAMDYLLYVPPTPAGPAGRPALLFLAERDTIGPAFGDLCVHGPDLALERDRGLPARFPFVVVSPRLPVGFRWTDRNLAKALAGLLDRVAASVPVDPARVSVSGIDNSAFAAWWLADALPHRFSALLWVTTRPDAGPPGDDGKLVRDLPGRAFLPADVTGRVSRQFAAQFARTRRDWATVPLPPGATPTADLPVYSDPATLDWLARQRRGPG